jgi:hypothetical protein
MRAQTCERPLTGGLGLVRANGYRDDPWWGRIITECRYVAMS